MSAKPVVVFGTGDMSSVAAHYLRHDGGWAVVAFVVDRSYLVCDELDGLPVVAFETLAEHFAPAEHAFIAPLGWTAMNALRARKLEQAKAMGYSLASFISSHAIVNVGVEIGEAVCIYEGAMIGPFASVGDNVQIRSGVSVSHHVQVGSHTFFGTRAAVGGRVRIGERCVIGMGAVLRSGVRIADRSFIGAGAVVVADTEPEGIYVGNPARRLQKSPFAITGDA